MPQFSRFECLEKNPRFEYHELFFRFDRLKLQFMPLIFVYHFSRLEFTDMYFVDRLEIRCPVGAVGSSLCRRLGTKRLTYFFRAKNCSFLIHRQTLRPEKIEAQTLYTIQYVLRDF